LLVLLGRPLGLLKAPFLFFNTLNFYLSISLKEDAESIFLGRPLGLGVLEFSGSE
jgi:hypothetical protein